MCLDGGDDGDDLLFLEDDGDNEQGINAGDVGGVQGMDARARLFREMFPRPA